MTKMRCEFLCNRNKTPMGQLVHFHNNTPAKVQEVHPETKQTQNQTGKCTNPACIPDSAAPVPVCYLLSSWW